MEGKFNLLYFFKGAGKEDWFKALGMGWRLLLAGILLFFLIAGVRGCFVKLSQNVNKPHVIVTPFATVDKIDQSNVQIAMTEKTWEAGLGGGALTYDSKAGLATFAWIKKKW